ncbi:MAG: hypothetical protein PHH29_17820, partial [Desulfuromonadaceae bacterium]|nr:hypothetical protein [Desulfuromonadaceae bacterium]
RTHVFQLPIHSDGDAQNKMSIKNTLRGVSAFGPLATKDELEHRHHHEWQFHKTRITDEYSYEKYKETTSDDVLLMLLLQPEGTVLFNSEEFPLEPEEGDIILSYVPSLPGKR